jgi:hypothetical protein
MALTEITKIDQIEVLDFHLQIRTANIIEKDGVEISRTFSRSIVEAGDDLTNQDPKVQSIANAIWTPEIIAQYRDSLSDSVSNQQ